MSAATLAEFRALAERRLRAMNPDAPELGIRWEFTSRGYVPDRIGDGATRHGRAVLTAPGYRPRPVVVTMARGSADVSIR